MTHRDNPEIQQRIREAVANLNAAGVPATEEDAWRLCEQGPAPRLPCLQARRLKACEAPPPGYRRRRGRLVPIPPEWQGVCVGRATKARRASKQPPGQRKPPAQTRKAREERAARRRESEGCDDGDG